MKDNTPFTRGDLGLQLEERRPWVFTEGFGYDKSQGYHFLLGAQRLNVAGMGRTLDFGIRAGDNTLQNPTLRKWFPTGIINRSLDDYSVAYTDPWPGFLHRWFDTKIQWRTAADYIEEATATYFARKRRLTTAFSWKVGEHQTMEAGYRFERTDFGPNREGISDVDLQEIARTNKLRAVISAPYLQLVRDLRDKPYDPTTGSYFAARLDFANQLFGTTPDSSFVKLDLRQQWNWSFGYRGERGVLAATAHVGLARPTAASAEDLPSPSASTRAAPSPCAAWSRTSSARWKWCPSAIRAATSSTTTRPTTPRPRRLSSPWVDRRWRPSALNTASRSSASCGGNLRGFRPGLFAPQRGTALRARAH